MIEQLTWRDAQTLSMPQRQFMDALTCQGQYKHMKNPRVLYGGAGFGGKSHGLRAATVEISGVLAQLGYPGQWGALFCSDYPKLVDRHVRGIQKQLGGLGRLRESRTKGLHFEFYNKALGGFYLRNVGSDPESYRGIEFSWLLIDELTEFTREQFDNLMYLLRSPENLPFETMGAATNPDGIGHGWVKRWWIERDFEGDPEEMRPDRFVFIPAKATDNPTFTDERALSLKGFSNPMLVKSRWEGSWDIASGVRFPQFRRGVHTFDLEDMEQWYGMPFSDILLSREVKIIGSLDYGTDINSASAYLLHAFDSKGHVWTVFEGYMQGMFLADQARDILEVDSAFKTYDSYCDPSLVGKDSDGISRLVKFRQHGKTFIPGINDRVEGWASIDEVLQYRMLPDGTHTAPRWRISNKCTNLIRQVATAPRSQSGMRPNAEDVDPSFKDDHALDSARYAIHSYFKHRRRAPTEQGGDFASKWLRDQARSMLKERNNESGRYK